MVVEIVTTGSELLLGQIINTNAAYMASELNALGFDVLYQTTVGDNRSRMAAVIRQALSRADIVITTGGLGPTQGDITKEVCAAVFGRALLLHEASLARIKAHFVRVQRAMTDNNIRQAMIPEGAEVFNNYAGTAPGVVLEANGKLLINLPGPPSEMKDMFQRSLNPFLEDKYGFDAVIVSRVLDTFGIGESSLETSIQDLILAQTNPTLALLVRPSGVIIRITAKAKSKQEAEALIADMEKEIRSRIDKYIYAVDDAAMEDIVGEMLTARQLTIACAESCTGGFLTSRLTDVPGSSAYVMGSIVSYTNEVKSNELGVSRELLQTQGAVCEDVAKAMAEGAALKIGTDIGVGVTGIAGPDGGTAEKPVGLVYIAVAGRNGTVVKRNVFSGRRKEIKYKTTQTALDMVRHYIEKL